MKYKYEDLLKIMKQLDRHSQKGDIEIIIEPRTNNITITYISNVGTEATLQCSPSEMNAFVTINERKWLHD